MIKQFKTYSLAIMLAAVISPPSFAEDLCKKANNHLNEAQHEYLEENDKKKEKRVDERNEL